MPTGSVRTPAAKRWDQSVVIRGQEIARGLTLHISPTPRDEPVILDVHLHQCLFFPSLSRSLFALPGNCTSFLRQKKKKKLAGNLKKRIRSQEKIDSSAPANHCTFTVYIFDMERCDSNLEALIHRTSRQGCNQHKFSYAKTEASTCCVDYGQCTLGLCLKCSSWR